MKKMIFSAVLAAMAATASATTPNTQQLPDSVYLMAYFKSQSQHLYYAWSTDGTHWNEANGGEHVFQAYDESIWMRDPYINRVVRNGKSTYHLVHTWGWDNPAIFHWQSDDLVNWTAADGGKTTDSGKIYVMDGKDGHPSAPNAWAPEFTYVPEEDRYYIYWSSRVDGRQLHYVTTTSDWEMFAPAQPLFDPGFTAIDLTVVRVDDTYYGYYKDERDGEKTILCATTHSLDPTGETFSGAARLLPADYRVEVEGPTVFRKIGGKGWIGYFDKFNFDAGISYVECSDLARGDWVLIPDTEVSNVPEVKHGSVIVISRDELIPLLKSGL